MKRILSTLIILLFVAIGANAQTELVTTGSGSAYDISYPAAFSYSSGITITFKAHAASTAGPVTLNINGLGAKTIKKNVTADLALGDIILNQYATVIYDGTNFQLTSSVPSSSTGVFATAANITSNSPGNFTLDDFVFGSPQLNNDADVNHYSRMYFDKSKSAFRAGYESGAGWNDVSVGNYSVAMGGFVRAGGAFSAAFGNSYADGDYSAALVRGNTTSSAIEGFSVGYGSYSRSARAFSLGFFADVTGSNSFGLGSYVKTNASNSFVIGTGVGVGNELLNTTANSIMLGSNSDLPTLFISPSAGVGTIGKIGVGTTNPLVRFSNYDTNITDESSWGLSGDNTFLWAHTEDGNKGYAAAIYNEGNTSTNNGLLVKINNTTPDESILTLNSGGFDRFKVTGEGLVGIGTTIPGSKLDVEVGAATNTNVIRFGDSMKGYLTAGGSYVGLATNDGSQRLVIVNSGAALGNVGIGTSTPTAKLHIGGTAGVDGIRFPDGTLQTTAAASGAWSKSGTNIYPTTITDNVGIGTTTPSGVLEVFDPVGYNGIVVSNNLASAGSSVTFKTDDINVRGEIGTNGSGAAVPNSMYITQYGAHPIKFATNLVDRMLIDANGNVGVGTNVPNARFQVFATSNTATLASISGAVPSLGAQRFSFSAGDVLDIGFQAAPNYAAWIQAGFNGTAESLLLNPLGGTIGIGNNLPTEALDVTGNIKFSGALMPGNNAGTAGQVLTSAGPGLPTTWTNISGSLSGGTTNYVTKWTSGTTLSSTSLIYDDGTNVGIGTSSPSFALDVRGASTFAQVKSTGYGGFIIDKGTVADNGYLILRTAGSDYWSLGQQGSLDFRIYNWENGRSDLTILNASGNVGIGTTAPSNNLSFGNTADQKIAVENSGGSTVGRNLTIASGSAGGGFNNVAGGNMIIQAGVGTGTGESTISFQNGTTLGNSPTVQTMSTKMTILGNGNVGIATTTPAHKLDVVGDRIRLTKPASAQALSLRADGTYLDLQAENTRLYITASTNESIHLNPTSTGNILLGEGGGNVGIGLATPAAKLDVAGQIKISGGTPGLGKVLTSDAVGLATWSTINGLLAGGTTNYIPKWSSANTLSSTSLVYDNGTAVGIGTTTPATNAKLNVVGGGISVGGDQHATLHLAGIYGGNGRMTQINPIGVSLNALNLMASTDAGGAHNWWSWGVNANTWSINPSTGFTSNTGLYITSAGNVGVGNSAPGGKLDITHDQNLEALTLNRNNAAIRKSTITFKQQGVARYEMGIDVSNNNSNNFFLYDTQSGATRFMIHPNGDVGIGMGTTAPSGRLHVGGNTIVSGNVGIGIVAPTFQLELSANSAGKPGSNAWTVTSDERLKTNVKKYEGGLNDLLKINPVWFTYTGEAGMPKTTHVGIIAQELEKIAPYMISPWIYTDKDGNKKEYLGVDNGAMTYMLINSVQEQQQQIEKLKAENQSLKSDIDLIKAKLGIENK